MIVIKDTNLNALLIAPRPALMDWANAIFSDDPVHLEDPLAYDASTIYLIPDFDNYTDALDWLKANFQEIFYEELFGWCMDEEQYPPLTWEKFNEFCLVSYQSMVHFVDEEE